MVAWLRPGRSVAGARDGRRHTAQRAARAVHAVEYPDPALRLAGTADLSRRRVYPGARLRLPLVRVVAGGYWPDRTPVRLWYAGRPCEWAQSGSRPGAAARCRRDAG